MLRWLLFLAVWVLGSCLAREEENPVIKDCTATSHHRRLYVSTVDGVLTALDMEGQQLWSHVLTQPLFSSTLSYGKPSKSLPNLIPGLDKFLYHWDGSRLERLPVTVEELIDSSFPYGEGVTLVGSKVKEVTGINLKNGQPLYECSQFKCHRYDNQSLISRVDVLKVTAQRVTVREADELTGEETWNFTVGEVRLSLVEGQEEEGEEVSCLADTLGWSLNVDSSRGVVSAVSSTIHGETVTVWEKKLSSPVMGVWVQNGGKLEEVTPPSTTPLLEGEKQPALMLLHYENQYYIQSAGGQEEVRGQPRTLGFSPSFSLGQPQMQVELSGEEEEEEEEEEGEENTGLVVYYGEDSFLRLCTAGPSGLAMYFYLEEEWLAEGYDSCCSAEENCSGEGASCPFPPQPPQRKRNVGSWVWSAVKYSLFSLFVLGLNTLHRYHRLHRRRTHSSSSSEIVQDEEFPLLDHLFGHCAQQPAVEAREGSGQEINKISSANTITPEEEPPPRQKRLESQDSRFDSDYELRGCLGKGGFGVVYHVRNSTDGGEYAVKRIQLPSKKSAREKVMREVHALAQLEHPGIVRYFHSWVEKAPPGWSEMEEWTPLSRRESYACAEQSPFPSTAGSLRHPHTHTPPSSRLFTISPSPSFSSLNHSTIHSTVPPLLSVDSRNSSFIIEFKEDTCRGGGGSVEGDGCFSRELLSNRDDWSLGSDCSEATGYLKVGVPPEPPTYLFIQMQLCKKDSLREWLARHVHNRSRTTVMHFFEQVLDAVVYVHDKGMMHRDLKPSNIFFSLDGSVKVGDFGLVTGNVFPGLQNSYIALKSLAEDHRHTGNIGSHFYMSPEQMSGAKYDQKVDIFSLGVIFFELHHPFLTEMERVKVLEDLRKQKFPPRFSTHLPREGEFVEWLMAPLASKRPSAAEVLNSDQFQNLRTSCKQNSSKQDIIPNL